MGPPRVWFVYADQVEAYTIDGDRAYRPWRSVWVDLGPMRVIRICQAESLEESVSATVFGAVADLAGRPDAIHFCGDLADGPAPGWLEGIANATTISDGKHHQAIALIEQIRDEDDEDGSAEAVALAPLVGAKQRGALIAAANRFAEVSLGIEPTVLRLRLEGEAETMISVAETGVLGFDDLAGLMEGVEDGAPPANFLSLGLEPRRMLDPELRAEIESAEPEGPMTEWVAMVLCTDADRIVRPATVDDCAKLESWATLATAWLENPELAVIDGVTIEVFDPDALLLGLDGGSEALQLKIVLEGSDPPVWRRVVVPASITLAGLHHVIQRAMGWGNEHLHQFTIKKQRYGPDPDGWLGELDEGQVRLGDVVRSRQKFEYLYDFGDSWRHVITVEKKLAEHDGLECVDGGGACPPEDCGGIWGYSNMLESLANPASANREDLLEWLGADYDPAAVDLGATRRAVQALGGRRRG